MSLWRFLLYFCGILFENEFKNRFSGFKNFNLNSLITWSDWKIDNHMTCCLFIKILLLSQGSQWSSYRFGRLIRIDGKYRHSCYLKRKFTFYALNFKFIIKILLENKKFGMTHIELFYFSSSVIKFLWFCILEI